MFQIPSWHAVVELEEVGQAGARVDQSPFPKTLRTNPSWGDLPPEDWRLRAMSPEGWPPANRHFENRL